MILLIFAFTWNYVCCLVALNLDDFRFFLLMLKVAWSFQVRIVLSFCRPFWSWSQTSWVSLYFRTKNQYQIWLSLFTRFNWSNIICLIFEITFKSTSRENFHSWQIILRVKETVSSLWTHFNHFTLFVGAWGMAAILRLLIHYSSLKVSMLLCQWVPADKKISMPQRGNWTNPSLSHTRRASYR